MKNNYWSGKKHSPETKAKMRLAGLNRLRPKRGIELLDEIARVPLTRGYFAIIDASDATLIGKHNWYPLISKRDGRITPITSVKGSNRQKTVYLSRLIMGVTDPTLEVDHIDCNPLNNRRDNLRVCLGSDNICNRPPQRNNALGLIGVRQRGGKFDSRIRKNGRSVYIGSFNTAEQAARERDKLALELHGEFARLNFPSQ